MARHTQKGQGNRKTAMEVKKEDVTIHFCFEIAFFSHRISRYFELEAVDHIENYLIHLLTIFN